MINLYMILIPALVIVAVIGLWIMKDMTPKARFYGKLLLSAACAMTAGLITIAFISSVLGLFVVGGAATFYAFKYIRSKT